MSPSGKVVLGPSHASHVQVCRLQAGPFQAQKRAFSDLPDRLRYPTPPSREAGSLVSIRGAGFQHTNVVRRGRRPALRAGGLHGNATPPIAVPVPGSAGILAGIAVPLSCPILHILSAVAVRCRRPSSPLPVAGCRLPAVTRTSRPAHAETPRSTRTSRPATGTRRSPRRSGNRCSRWPPAPRRSGPSSAHPRRSCSCRPAGAR